MYFLGWLQGSGVWEHRAFEACRAHESEACWDSLGVCSFPSSGAYSQHCDLVECPIFGLRSEITLSGNTCAKVPGQPHADWEPWLLIPRIPLSTEEIPNSSWLKSMLKKTLNSASPRNRYQGPLSVGFEVLSKCAYAEWH